MQRQHQLFISLACPTKSDVFCSKVSRRIFLKWTSCSFGWGRQLVIDNLHGRVRTNAVIRPHANVRFTVADRYYNTSHQANNKHPSNCVISVATLSRGRPNSAALHLTSWAARRTVAVRTSSANDPPSGSNSSNADSGATESCQERQHPLGAVGVLGLNADKAVNSVES